MAKIEFEQLKQKRRNLFMECFNFVSEKIDDTYKGTLIENLTTNKALSSIYSKNFLTRVKLIKS